MLKIIFLLIFSISFLSALEKRDLYLKWKHQFQFAGYYMAKEKGFYKKAGFDVNIIEKNNNSSVIDQVLNTPDSFGVSNTELIQASLKGKSVVALAAIFQENPLVFLSHKDSGILTFNDIKNKKVGLHKNRDISLMITLESIAISKDRYETVDVLFDYSLFLNNEIDLIPAYITDQPYEFAKNGLDVNIIDPIAYGINFYGDILFTSKDSVQNDTQSVKQFKEATIKGWQYAIENIDETIDIIKNIYKSEKSIDALKYEAMQTIKLIKADRIPIGTITQNKIKNIVNAYNKIDGNDDMLDFNDFIFENDIKKQDMGFGFTSEEKEWIKNNANLRLGIDTKWLPLEKYEDNRYTGLVADYYEYFKKAGLNFDLVVKQPWRVLLDDIEDNKVDLLSALAANNNRAKKMYFTKPIISFPLMLAGTKEQSFIENMDSLKGKKIGVVEGYFTHELLSTKYKDIKAVPFEDITEGLHSLSSKKIDYFLASIPVMNNIIYQEGFDNLKFVTSFKEKLELRIGVSTEHPILVSILDKMIINMPRELKTKIYNKWIGVDLETKKDYSFIWRFLVLLLIIIMVIIYWNRKLVKEINRRKVAEANEKYLKDIAESSSKAKSEFLSNMSHEIRTPMNAVIGFTEVLEKTQLDTKQKEYLQIIRKSSKALISIINDILEISKIESGKMPIQKVPVNMRSVCKDIHMIFLTALDEKNLNFIVQIDSNLPEFLMLDEVRIRQVLINLVGNSIKFTDEGHIKIVIHCNKKANKVKLKIEVHDTGIGIPLKDQKKIFESFTQQSGQSTRKYGGTGLGLSISKKFVELMDGTINVESAPKKGSIFSISLYNIDIVEDVQIKDISEQKSDKNIKFLDSKILIVDDIATNRSLIKNYYINSQIKFYEAKNGVEGIQKAKEVLPDIILMDIKMPVMDGYVATKALKKDNETKHIPILALSASVLQEDQEKIEEYDFDSFIHKPINFKVLDSYFSKYIKSEIIEDKQIDRVKQKIKKDDPIDNLVDEIKDMDGVDKFISKIEKANASGSMDDIKGVSDILKDMDNSICEKFAKQIDENIESFNIEALDKSLKDLLNKLRGR